MFSAAVVAFGHYLGFFALTAALVVQIALLTDSPTIEVAKRIQRADRAYGLMAILVLIMGILRVLYYEKGVDYYFANSFFMIKMILFILVALMSAYPTITYLGWGKAIKAGKAPELCADSVLKLKRVLHYELLAIMGILLCASLMAHGIG